MDDVVDGWDGLVVKVREFDASAGAEGWCTNVDGVGKLCAEDLPVVVIVNMLSMYG